MRTAVHGTSRLGERRALKWALESFWAGEKDAAALRATAAAIRRQSWERLQQAGIDVVPSNDFSLYDHVLDAALTVGAFPARFDDTLPPDTPADPDRELERYFAMARGAEVDGTTVAPLGMTKWFDTNYHHLVPELDAGTALRASSTKAVGEMAEAAALGVTTTPVLLGPCTFLWRSITGPPGSDPLERLDELVGVYVELLEALAGAGAAWVRLDEPGLVEDRSPDELAAVTRAYRRLASAGTRPRVAISTYFGHVGAAMPVLRDLPVEGVGLDLCAGPENAELIAAAGGLGSKTLFAGVVDGRNVWVNDLAGSLDLLEWLQEHCADLVVSTSCSLLHVPDSLAPETGLDPEVRPWLAFAEEKLGELTVLADGLGGGRQAIADDLERNGSVLAARRTSLRTIDPAVRRALAEASADPRRGATPNERRLLQRARLGLPPLPTTTIGSFPQTPRLRSRRAAWRSGREGEDAYETVLRQEIDHVVALQEELGIDLLVHGEPERDDMVRYFAAQLTGFALPRDGWVQSYGSRCVRPPIILGDVSRPAPMSVGWTTYAQSRTARPVKGMLTGPVTMLRWSFGRDDVSPATTAAQLGLAIGEEVADLEQAGIAVVQVDEPALREGLPLRLEGREEYLAWATRAFRLASSRAAPATQVHTHMCYAALGPLVGALGELEVDVVSFEAARSHMALVPTLAGAAYEGTVGPGVYDVHSPLVPSVADIEVLVTTAIAELGPERVWINPDCGLKTRRHDEIVAALEHMVTAARHLRTDIAPDTDDTTGDAAP